MERAVLAGLRRMRGAGLCPGAPRLSHRPRWRTARGRRSGRLLGRLRRVDERRSDRRRGRAYRHPARDHGGTMARVVVYLMLVGILGFTAQLAVGGRLHDLLFDEPATLSPAPERTTPAPTGTTP